MVPGIMLEPDIVTFNAAISACEKANQWKQALALVSEAQGRGLSCDVITFNAETWLKRGDRMRVMMEKLRKSLAMKIEGISKSLRIWGY